MSIHEKIKEVLLKHKGKENGIKSHEVAEIVGIDPGPSNVTIRKRITETIEKYGIPIGSSTYYGYYLMKDKEELKEYNKFLDRKIQGNINRKSLLTAAYYRYYEGESLEFSGEIIGPIDDDENENEA
jgi:hypothetical protein